MEFYEHLKSYLNDEEIKKLKASLLGSVKKSIIINLNKIDDAFILKEFPLLKKHPLVPHCYLYDENIYPLGKHIYFEQGLYYIFEPCSALVNYFLSPTKEDTILDLCAAPGGKTVHLASLKQNQGIIISNEISRERALVLSSNIERMGFSNVIVTNNTIDDFVKFEGTFDKIILDAPCSGSGMFRKETKMQDDWSYSKVLNLTKIQKELILKAYALLAPGGRMVYSTCSFSYEEDEEVVKYLLENTDAKLGDFQDDPSFYHSKTNIGIHLFPFLFEGEGHYICVIEKPGVKEETRSKEKKDKFDEIKKECEVEGYVYNFENIYYLLPKYFDFKKLKVIRGGLKLGSKEKYGFEKDHALSHYLTHSQNEYELTPLELESYVSGNSLNIKTKDGVILMKYHGFGLGFGKSNKSRINNKYPKGLRINHIVH